MKQTKPPKPQPPRSLNASGMACFWSITHLIETRPFVYLWTATLATVEADWYIAGCRRYLFKYARDAVRSGRLDPFGGVRVTEIHPGGHGLHDHWVMATQEPIVRDQGFDRKFRNLCAEAGFGRVSMHLNPATEWSAIYLSKYLLKSTGELLPGARRWSCFGDYDGIKTREIVYESEQNTVFKTAYADAKEMGFNNRRCFREATRATNDWLIHATDI